MRKVLYSLLVMLVLGVGLITPECTYACSCMMADPPLVSLENASAVFVGKVTTIQDSNTGAVQSSADPMKVSFQVSEVWKGNVFAEQALFTSRDSASCGFNFEVGKEYLVYAIVGDTGLTTNLCSRTMELAQAKAEDLPAFAQSLKPQQPQAVAPVVTPTPAAPTASGSISTPAMLIGVGSVVLVGLVLIGLKMRSRA